MMTISKSMVLSIMAFNKTRAAQNTVMHCALKTIPLNTIYLFYFK